MSTTGIRLVAIGVALAIGGLATLGWATGAASEYESRAPIRQLAAANDRMRGLPAEAKTSMTAAEVYGPYKYAGGGAIALGLLVGAIGWAVGGSQETRERRG